MMSLFIHWNADPTIFHLGSLSIRWYGLLFAASFFFGYLVMWKIFKKEKIEIKYLDSLTTYMVIGTVVGARLGHCFFYQPDYYLSHPLDILKVWEGGLASHGAAIGIIISLLLYSRKHKMSFWWVIDRIVIVVALSGFFIRMGNLMNSEIFGTQTSLPWGFYFLRVGEDKIARHPTQLYEGISYLMIFIYLLWYYFRKDGKPAPSRLFGIFLALVFGVRFLIEFLKEPQVSFEKSMILNMGQCLSIPFILAGMFLIWYSAKLKSSTVPGEGE